MTSATDVAFKAQNTAVIVVDMLKDGVDFDQRSIGQASRAIVPTMQTLLAFARDKGMRVVYACDSFLPSDFMFSTGQKAHSLRGSEGAEVTSFLPPQPEDYVFEKRRMSSFFRTDLDLTLRSWGVDTVAVTGISTPVCVLLTAMDALQNDFRTVILEDCCAAHKQEVHEAALLPYRKTLLYPLLQVMTARDFMEQLVA